MLLTRYSIITPYSSVSPPDSSPFLIYNSNSSIGSVNRIYSRSKHSCSKHHFNTSITGEEKAALIYSARVVRYGYTNFALELPVTSSSSLQGRLLIAAMMSSMSESLFGVM